jgi:hypothetical protein
MWKVPPMAGGAPAPHHAGGQLFHQFADAGRSSALAAVHGQEGLGHGDNLRRFKRDHRAVTADDAVVTEVAGSRNRLLAVLAATAGTSAGLMVMS